MADKELRVNLKADDDITPAAKKAKASLDAIPDSVDVQVEAKGLDELTSKLGDLPGLLGTLGGAGAAGGVAALAAGMFAAADAAAELAIEAKTTADLTGSTVEEASKLQNLWGRTGADVNDLNDVLLQMNGALAQAPDLAAKLGVNLSDGKNIQERFVELTDKLASGQLSAVEASQLFGEEGVRQVGKLRTMYGGLADDLESMPSPVDDADVQQAVEMKAAVEDLKATLSATVGIVGKELVPLFGDLATLANTATDAMPGGKEGGGADALKFIRDWGTGIGVIAKGAAALTTGGDDITVSLGNVTAAGTDQAAVMQEVANRLVVVRDAAEDAAAEEAELAAATLEGVAAATDYAAAVQGMADARRAAADSTFAVRDAQRDYNESLTEYAEAAADVELSAADLEAVQDSSTETAIRLADSQSRLASETAAAAGQTFDAADSQDVFNQSMIDSARQASGPLKQAIINYIATVNDIPPEKVSEIVAITNYASLSSASAALNQTAADRDSKIRAEAVNIPPTEAGLNYLARPRTVVITPQVQAARNLAVPPGATGFAAPMTATATATGPATYTTPVAVAAAPLRLTVPTPTVVFNFNGPSLGNRFDTQRAVTKALRAHQRLNGVRA